MCLGAIYWARLKIVFYGCNKEDAMEINFDDRFIYDELEKEMQNRKIRFVQLLRKDALSVFRNWQEKNDKTKYWPKKPEVQKKR